MNVFNFSHVLQQKLGVIIVPYNEDAEVDTVAWAGLAAQTASKAQAEVTVLKQNYDAQQATIQKLSAQLEEFIVKKKEHEDDLLQKFTQLLNSKKAKIRDQQRIIAGTLPKEYVSEDEVPRKADKSGKGKRKAGDKDESEVSSDDGFEGLRKPVRSKEQESDEDATRASTPEEETASDTDDEAMDDVRPPSLPSNQNARAAGNSKSVHKKAENLPPPRALPFAKKKEDNAHKTRSHDTEMNDANSDGSTEDDDDEL
jgi:hypothetical protein